MMGVGGLALGALAVGGYEVSRRSHPLPSFRFTKILGKYMALTGLPCCSVMRTTNDGKSNTTNSKLTTKDTTTAKIDRGIKMMIDAATITTTTIEGRTTTATATTDTTTTTVATMTTEEEQERGHRERVRMEKGTKERTTSGEIGICRGQWTFLVLLLLLGLYIRVGEIHDHAVP